MAISDLRAALNRHGNVQRKYRWRINVSFPAGLVANEDARDMSILATSTNTPKSTLGEILLPYGGREFPLPGDRKYEPLNLTFINTQDNFGHNILDLWSQQFNGDNTNTASDTVANLVADWELELLDDAGNATKTWNLEDCWPQEVGELELDQASQDEFGTYSAVIRYFKSATENSR